MRFALAYGKDNIAGRNIAEDFKKLGFAPDIPVIELPKDAIYSDNVNEKNYPELKNIDFIIFSSTHRSEKNFPSLCLHAPGNWRTADLGGHPGKVCRTSAFVLKYLFKKLNENAKDLANYNITMEATHHGPMIDKPCCFIEVGSSENEWNDRQATSVVAKTILSLQDYEDEIDWIPCLAIGGPHYCPNFNKVQLDSKYAISHVIQEYAFPVTELMLREAEEKTIEQIKEVLIDWKGCGKSEDRAKVIEMIKKSGLHHKRTSEIEKK
jgi:D-aminoacyl-tRNA deacylase